MSFAWIVAAIAIMAGITAAIAGAGIGSLLVPLLSLRIDFGVAVALATLPHLVGAVVRLWPLRHHVDRQVLRSFGITCAVASLLGALAHPVIGSGWLTRMFAGLLVLAGLVGLSGAEEKLHLGRAGSWIAGIVSGFAGGVAGEQGGMRAVALLGFHLRRDAFVATTTAIAIIVDAMRAPVYLVARWDQFGEHATLLGIMVGGVVVGTLIGQRVLRRVPERIFRRIVAIAVLVIGVLLFLRPTA